MKILITSVIDLERSAPNRLHHFIDNLANRHEVSVISINDWWKAKYANRGEYWESFDKKMSGVDCRTLTTKRMNLIRQEMTAGKLIDPEYYQGTDVVLNYNSMLFGHTMADMLKCPMLYDLADDLPAMVSTSPQVPTVLRPIARTASNLMLRRSVARSRRVTGISLALQDSYKIPKDKFSIIPNGVDADLFRPKKPELRESLGLDGSFVMGYVGVLREWVDMEPVIKAISGIDGVKLLVVGAEGRLEENKCLVKEHGLEDRVVFTGNVPYHKVPEYISSMDACLIPFKPNAVAQNSVPLKLFEYMACERPVISTRLKGVVECVDGRISYADNVEEYSRLIRQMLRGDFHGDLKDNREFVVRNYDWKSLATKLEKAMEITAS